MCIRDSPFHHPVPPPPPLAASFTDQVFFNGATLTHATSGGSGALTQPDDITSADGHIFVGFQNGVGPQGQPSSTGNSDSTIVELDGSGHAVAQWDIAGKCDGLSANPYTGQVVATVNEDANSSLYTIDPWSGTVAHLSLIHISPKLRCRSLSCQVPARPSRPAALPGHSRAVVEPAPGLRHAPTHGTAATSQRGRAAKPGRRAPSA